MLSCNSRLHVFHAVDVSHFLSTSNRFAHHLTGGLGFLMTNTRKDSLTLSMLRVVNIL